MIQKLTCQQEHIIQKKKKESTSTNETLSDINNTFYKNETIQQENSQNENIQECLSTL